MGCYVSKEPPTMDQLMLRVSSEERSKAAERAAEKTPGLISRTFKARKEKQRKEVKSNDIFEQVDEVMGHTPDGVCCGNHNTQTSTNENRQPTSSGDTTAQNSRATTAQTSRINTAYSTHTQAPVNIHGEMSTSGRVPKIEGGADMSFEAYLGHPNPLGSHPVHKPTARPARRQEVSADSFESYIRDLPQDAEPVRAWSESPRQISDPQISAAIRSGNIIRPQDEDIEMAHPGARVDLPSLYGSADENRAPTSNVNVPALQRHSHSLKENLSIWYKLHVLYFDLGHVDTVEESHKRVQTYTTGGSQCLNYFSDNEKTLVKHTIVPKEHLGPLPLSALGDCLIWHTAAVESARATGMPQKMMHHGLARALEGLLGIKDGGEELQNRIWFLRMVDQNGLQVSIVDLQAWDNEMKGVYDEVVPAGKVSSFWQAQQQRDADPFAPKTHALGWWIEQIENREEL